MVRDELKLSLLSQLSLRKKRPQREISCLQQALTPILVIPLIGGLRLRDSMSSSKICELSVCDGLAKTSSEEAFLVRHECIRRQDTNDIALNKVHELLKVGTQHIFDSRHFLKFC